MEEQLTLKDEIFHNIMVRFSKADVLFHASIPVAKHYIKKNNRPVFTNKATGRPFLGKSKELKLAEQYLMLQFRSVANKYNVKIPIEGPVWVVFLFYIKKEDFFTKEGNISKTRADLSNMYQIVEDALQAAGIIKDDNQICAHDLSRRLPANETKLDVFVLRHEFDFVPSEALDS